MNDNGNIPDKRRRLKVTHVLILLLLICIGLYVYYRLNLKSNLQDKIDAIRADGYPTNCIELDMWYKIPPNVENAAYTIIDAVSCYKKWDKDKSKFLPVVGRGKLPARTEPLDEETKALIIQYIADNKEALELLHTGAAIKHCRYLTDLSASRWFDKPELPEIKMAAKMLKLEGILHVENGDSESAIRSIKSCFGIARSLANGPQTAYQILHIACRGTATTTIEYCVNRFELADEQLVELIEYIRNAERISDISCAFVGERCKGLNFFKNPETVDPDLVEGIPFRPILAVYGALGLTNADTIIYLDLMDDYIKSAQLPLHKRHEAITVIDAKLRSTSHVHLLFHTIMPALSRITNIDIRNIAHLQTARIGLAIERYRLAAGRLPGNLSDLVPVYLESVPIDPFDGNELRYKRLETGFAVYSIGEDLSDDGGKERQYITRESPNWDVTFIVER